MKRLLTMAAALLLAGCSSTKSPTQIFRSAAPSVVVIKAGDGFGSGFVVKHDSKHTYILTNSHVVNRVPEVTVKWHDGKENKGKVVGDYGGDPYSRDLAMVRIDGRIGKALKFESKLPSVGDSVSVIGAPKGLEYTITSGVLGQIRGESEYLQFDAAINPGNSGGPIFDDQGKVIGVATFKQTDGEGLSFGIAYPPTKAFLDRPVMDRLPLVFKADWDWTPRAIAKWNYKDGATHYIQLRASKNSFKRDNDIVKVRIMHQLVETKRGQYLVNLQYMKYLATKGETSCEKSTYPDPPYLCAMTAERYRWENESYPHEMENKKIDAELNCSAATIRLAWLDGTKTISTKSRQSDSPEIGQLSKALGIYSPKWDGKDFSPGEDSGYWKFFKAMCEI